jgi:hypothetical protein
MGRLAVGALRAVLVVVLAGTVFVQALMVWALVSGSGPEDGSLPLTTLRELGFGGEVAGLYRRYRHAYPGPAIDVLAAFGFSIQGLDARPATPLAGRPEPKKETPFTGRMGIMRARAR